MLRGLSRFVETETIVVGVGVDSRPLPVFDPGIDPDTPFLLAFPEAEMAE